MNSKASCIIILIIVILAVIAFAGILLSGQYVSPEVEEEYENFNSEEQIMTAEEEQEATNEESQVAGTQEAPYVSASSGALVDGPGYELGEVEGASSAVPSSVPSNYYFLDDGAGGEMSIQHNMCSKACCSEQWPTPFKLKHDPYVCNNKDQFVPSRVFCNNTFQDSGCACISKKQASFLYNRGGNGREWF